MEIIKEEINPIIINVDTRIKVKEKINLDFMRKLFICLMGQNVWTIMLTDKNDKFYEIIIWSLEYYLDDLKSFKQGLKLCNRYIDCRLNNYSWNISFYHNKEGYNYNIIYYMSQPDMLIINGDIHKCIYDNIKKILSFDSIDKYMELEDYRGVGLI